jgi:cyclopropane-fatty-acyl-phospholipid synthase
MIARTVASILLARTRAGQIEIVDESDGGRRHLFGPVDSDLRVTITAHDAAFWRALARGSLRLAEAYMDGVWDCDDLVTLVRIGAREMPRLDRWRRPFAPLRSALTRVPRNTRKATRRHISAHYDLGNDMFRLFLDESMTYSCAIFDEPGMTLHDAQLAKLDRVCRKLELSPDDHLLEIGTGWGSLAIHAAGEYGCRVTTTTLSREQHDIAVERIREAGLDDRVEVVMRDYRELRGRYDKLVSIEMVEAVGWQYFDTFFRSCSDLLAPDGLMLLQAITIDDRAYEVEKASRSFIKKLIFPSGCLPSIAVISRSTARATDLRMVELHDITASYPPTLARWRSAFQRSAERAEELGYDRRFQRLWRLYLCYSEGGFRERRIGDVQLLFAKPRYLGSRENMRSEMASTSTAGPREASLASASLPPGPST